MNLGDIVAHLKLDIKDFNSKLNDAMNNVNNMDDQFSGLKKVGQTFTEIGTALTLGVTAPIVAFGTAAVSASADFESAMSKVQALSGATGQDLKDLEEAAKHYGATTQYSATQAADALGYMALAGWNSKESITALPGVLNLAASSEMELAEASDLVTDYLSAFGMEAGQAGQMADVLAYAQANSNTTTRGLGDAFKNCAVNAKGFGMDVESTTAVLGKLADQGLKGSEAGTALNAVIRDMTQKMKDGKIAIGDTKVAITDANGNFRDMTDIVRDVEKATQGMSEAERINALQTTFTADSIKAMGIMLNTGSDSLGEFTTELYNSNGAAEKMAKTMQDNLKGKVNELKSAFEGLCINLGNILLPAITNVIQWLTKLTSWFAGLPEPVQKVIVAIGLMAAAIGPVITAVGLAITTFTKVKEAIEIVRIAMMLLGDKLAIIGAASGPIFLIIAGITALVAAFLWLWNNCEEFRNFWINLWNYCKDTFNTFVTNNKATLEKLKKNFSDMWNAVKQVFTSALNIIKALFTGDLDLLKKSASSWKDGMLNLYKAGWDAIKNVFTLALNLIKQLFNDWRNTLSDNAKKFVDGLTKNFSTMWEGIKTIFRGALDVIKGLVDGDFTKVKKGIQTIWDGVKTYFKGVWENLKLVVKTYCADALTQIQSWGDKISNFFKVTLPNAWKALINWFKELPGKIKTELTNALNRVSEWVNNMKEKAKTAGQNFINKVIEFIKQLPEKITYYLVYIITYIVSWTALFVAKAGKAGLDFINKCIEYIKQLPGKIQTYLTDLVNKAQTWATNMANKAKTAATNFVNNAVNTIKNLPNTIQTYLTNIINKVTTFATNFASKAKTAAQNFVNNAKNAILNLPNTIQTYLTQAVNKVSSWGSTLSSYARTAAGNIVSGARSGVSTLATNIQSSLSTAASKVTSWGTTLANNARTAANRIPTTVKSALSNIGSTFTSVGSSICQGIARGISNGVSQITNAARTAASNALAAAKKALGINSPSKVFRDVVGQAIPEGIAVGIDKNQYFVDNSLEDMTSHMLDSVDVSPVQDIVNSSGISTSINTSNNDSQLLAMLSKLTDAMNTNKVESDSSININIAEFTNNTEEDVNDLMQRMAAAIRLNNIGKGVN